MTPIRLMRLLVLFATLLAPAMMKLTDAELAEIASAVPAGAVKGTRYPEAQMACLYIEIAAADLVVWAGAGAPEAAAFGFRFSG